MKSRNLTSFCIGLMCIVAVPTQGSACSCGRTTVEEAFAIRDVVFLGEVVAFDVVKISDQFGDHQYYKINFRVSRSWKGIEEAEVQAYAATTSGSCGYDSMSVGDQFLIYAGGEYTGFSDIYFHVCTRSHRVIDGLTGDIPVLNSIAEPTIFGDESDSGGPHQSGNLCGNLGFSGGLSAVMLLNLTVSRSLWRRH